MHYSGGEQPTAREAKVVPIEKRHDLRKFALRIRLAVHELKHLHVHALVERGGVELGSLKRLA